jgi:hypothetical protein
MKLHMQIAGAWILALRAYMRMRYTLGREDAIEVFAF